MCHVGEEQMFQAIDGVKIRKYGETKSLSNILTNALTSSTKMVNI